MDRLEFKPSEKIVRLSGDLEMAYSHQEKYDAKYGDVELVVIGTPLQIEMLMARLNGGFDGGVDEEEISPPEPTAKRPARALVRGDWVEWLNSEDELREGMFLYEDSSGRGWVRIKKGHSARVPMSRLNYVADVPSSELILMQLRKAHENGASAVTYSMIHEKFGSPSDGSIWDALNELVESGAVVRRDDVLKNLVTYQLP